MATGVLTDFKVYNEQINGSMFEKVMQFVDAFGAGSRGAIVLLQDLLKGYYKYESFFTEGPAVEERSPTNTSSVTDNALSQEEDIDVKLFRSYRQALTRSQWNQIGKNPDEFAQIYGQQLATKMVQEELNSALRATSAALSGVAGLCYDYSGTGNLNYTALNNGLAKMGDAAQDIVCLVMHSKAWFDLMGAALSSTMLDVGVTVVKEGTTGTMGRPVIITDSAALVVSGTTSKYVTLGLKAGAVRAIESEEPYTASQEVTGLGNIVNRLQTEWAYNLGVKGFKYNVSGGGSNPNAAAVALSTNWTQNASSIKSCAGVRILTT